MMSPARWVLSGLAAVILAVVLLSDTYRPIFLSGSGVAQGALVAAIALGVVLTYRGSGVVNLANGAIAMYAAYTYTILRSQGDLFLPPLPNPLSLIEAVVHWFQDDDALDLPDLPAAISLGPTMQFWPALGLALGFCVLLGLALHFLVFRPLRTAPPLAKVVASVGVFLFLQAVILRRFAIDAKTVKPMPFVGKEQIDLGVTTITQEQLFVAVFVVVCTGVLSFAFARTRFGLATRAAAENERGAIALGFSPDLLAGVNWVLSTVITGLLGIFVASINSNVDPVVIPALIVPALSAALVGGFSSFWLTTLTAFLLGMQLPLVQTLGVREEWFPKAGNLAIPGVETLVPLLVIGLVLFVRGNALPGRGAIESGRLPAAPVPSRRSLRVYGPAAAVLTAVAGLFWLSPVYRDALATTLIGVIICLSVVVITGYVGQISLAPLTFAGISAFMVAELSLDQGWPFPWPILAGALTAMAVGLVVALPALRIRGVNLAIITLAFAVTADRLIFANEDVNNGIQQARVDAPDFINQTRGVRYELVGTFVAGDGKQPNPMTAVFVLVVAVLFCYLVANLRRSTTGRQMLAIRSNERAAASSGVNVAATKALAFGISAFIAGVGGAVLAYRSGVATPGRFSYEQSLALFAFAYLGGISRVSGAIVGGMLVTGGLMLTLGEELLGIPEEFGLLLGGLGLILNTIFNPEGIAAQMDKQLRRWAGRIRPPSGGDAASARPADATS